MLHNVQTRDKLLCMILAWTINNLNLCIMGIYTREFLCEPYYATVFKARSVDSNSLYQFAKLRVFCMMS